MKKLLPTILTCISLFLCASTFAQQLPNTTTSESAKAFEVLGTQSMLNADFASAKTYFQKAIALDPDYMLAHLLASVLSDGAEREQHLAAAQRSSMKLSAGEQALVASFSGDAEEFEKRKNARAAVMKAFPEAALPHFFAGRSQTFRERDYRIAVASFEKAASLDPMYAGPSQNQIGYLYLSKGEPMKAKAAFEKYIELSPNEANPYDSMGDWYIEQGQFSEAKKYFDRAFAINAELNESANKSLQAEMSLAQVEYSKAWNKQDAPALAAMFTPTGQLFAPDVPVVVGRKAITEYYQDAFSKRASETTLSPVITGFSSSGDLAVADGKAQIEVEGRSVSELKYVTTYAKHPGTGDWYISRLCWNAVGPIAVPSEQE